MGTEVILAIIGIISGGGLVGILSWWSTGGRSYRRELRSHIADQQTEIEKIKHRMIKFEEEADVWKEKYFDLVFGIKAYRLKLVQLAMEHNVPPRVIESITSDEDLDRLITRIEKV